MSELDRTAWAKEAQRIENKMQHARTQIEIHQTRLKALDRDHVKLLKKIADDYAEEHGD
jgi:uncharacterized membrane-anchored protein YhcB (DUF1043 family)